MLSLTWDQVRERRLMRNFLTKPAARRNLANTVGELCCVQAQVLSAAELGIGLRVSAADQDTVRDAFWKRRSIVKTYGPRETLHIVPSKELSLWMAALRYTRGINCAKLDDLTIAIGEVLDGRNLTRIELAAEVGMRVGSWAKDALSSNWGGPIRTAAYTGRLCFGLSRGQNITFVRTDQWIDDWYEMDEEEAIASVILRYVGTYGPVTPEHFSGWFGLKSEESKRIFAVHSSSLEEVSVEGEQAWVLASEIKKPWKQILESVFLVPRYDCYVLNSLKQRRSKRNDNKNLLPDKFRRRILSYGMGRLEGAVGLKVLLINGRVSGMWDLDIRAKHVSIRVEVFERASAKLKEKIAQQATRIARFYQRELKLSFGKLG